MFLRNVSTKKLILRFHCYFVVCSGKFKHFGKIQNKRATKMINVSVYTIKTRPHVKCFVRYLVIPTRFFYQKSHSFAALTLSISDTSTTLV